MWQRSFRALLFFTALFLLGLMGQLYVTHSSLGDKAAGTEIPLAKGTAAPYVPKPLTKMFPDRLLPRALIAGYPKCGTTTLFRLLSQHPQVVVGTKELNYFGFHFLTKSEYAESFPSCKEHPEDCEDGKITIDGTVGAVSMYSTPQEIMRDLPDVKLVFLFRDPVDRALSAYRMDLRNNDSWTNRNFTEYIQSSLAFLKKATARYEDRVARGTNKTFIETVIGKDEWRAARQIGMSLYYYLTKPYLDLFPRENILLLEIKELRDDPLSVLRKTFRFLDIREDVDVSFNFAINSAPRDSFTPDAASLQMLEKFYQPFTEKFNQLINEKML